MPRQRNRGDLRAEGLHIQTQRSSRAEKSREIRDVAANTQELATTSGLDGGEGGIRTHDTLARIPVFETGPFNHSGTSPCLTTKSSGVFRFWLRPPAGLNLSRYLLREKLASAATALGCCCGSALTTAYKARAVVETGPFNRSWHLSGCGAASDGSADFSSAVGVSPPSARRRETGPA